MATLTNNKRFRKRSFQIHPQLPLFIFQSEKTGVSKSLKHKFHKNTLQKKEKKAQKMLKAESSVEW
jgi:hypothetical protein